MWTGELGEKGLQIIYLFKSLACAGIVCKLKYLQTEKNETGAIVQKLAENNSQQHMTGHLQGRNFLLPGEFSSSLEIPKGFSIHLSHP